MSGNNRTILRNFQLLLFVFTVVILATGVCAYIFAATQLRNQLVLKCQALAATIAAVIAEDSDGYAGFLESMDMESDYYRRTKALLMQIKSVNQRHVEYIYTTRLVDDNTIMYVVGGEPPSSPTYTGPGVQDAITSAGRVAYETRQPVISEDFEDTPYGRRLSAFHPIVHKDTGAFLGMVGADIISKQYNEIMQIFVVQTMIGILAGLAVFALATRWFSGKVTLIVDRQRYAAYKAEQKLTLENATLERVNRMKTDLMSTLSHEARTPLAVLASYAGLVSLRLKHRGVDTETASDLDRIVSEARRVANLIDSMKTLTLHGGETSARVPLDFGEVIRQVARLYRPFLERGGVALNLHIEGTFPVYGNPGELTQVVFNLLQNAKDHTGHGSVSIRMARKAGTIVAVVTDTGSGIEPGLLPHLFERGVKGARGGAGIGLAICKTILEAHGGRIAIANTNGAEVTVTLPEYNAESGDEGERHGVSGGGQHGAQHQQCPGPAPFGL